MRRLALFLLLATLFIPASAQSTTPLTLQGSKGKLKAVIHKPRLASQKSKCAFVMILHGFTGNKNETLLEQISKGLQQRGIGSIRFDFNGHGESEGPFQEMTIENEIEDVKKVLDYVKSQPWVDVKRLGLAGHSQGGVVASMTAGLLGSDQIKALVLLAPAANIGEDVRHGSLLGTKFNINQIPERTMVWNHPVGRRYIEVARDMKMYETAFQFTGPVCVIHGSADNAVPCKYGKKYADGYKNATWVLQKDDGHGLGKHRSQTLSTIYNFFEKKL